MTIWREISKERPPHGEWIWIWDINKQQQMLVKYHGSEEDWKLSKDNSPFPIWTLVNEQEQEGD